MADGVAQNDKIVMFPSRQTAISCYTLLDRDKDTSFILPFYLQFSLLCVCHQQEMETLFTWGLLSVTCNDPPFFHQFVHIPLGLNTSAS